MDFYEDDSLIRKGFYSFYVHPTYLPIGTEIIGATFNSKGNIGFNDYPKMNKVTDSGIKRVIICYMKVH